MRHIETHKVPGLNEAIEIMAVDVPEYGPNREYELSYGPLQERKMWPIHFQKGPIKEVGVNGLSNEALLAVVRDRLEQFQDGPFACLDNQIALDRIKDAMYYLSQRNEELKEPYVDDTDGCGGPNLATPNPSK